MRKENVFLVTARDAGSAEALVQRVLCAADVQALHEFLRSSFPALEVIGVVCLVDLEATVAEIKLALGGAGEIPVFIDPAMAR